MQDYTGVIVEESLRDKNALQDFKILSTEVEKVTESHRTPWLQNWTMHKVEIPEELILGVAERLSRALSSDPISWYADFKNSRYHYIVFPRRVFCVDRRKPEQYDDVKAFGMGLGIPEHQLDFTPEIV